MLTQYVCTRYCFIDLCFVGFSFGGLLALSITARIWRLSLIAVAELRKKVICIAFGVPMLDIPAVSKTVVECPAMESIVHLIYLKDDMFPRLMRFMNLLRLPVVHDPAERLKHLSIADSEGRTQVQMIVITKSKILLCMLIQAFDNQFIMDCLISLQNASETNSSQVHMCAYFYCRLPFVNVPPSLTSIASLPRYL